MLGPAGSGKTVFLASMDKKLSIQGESGFFLDIDGQEKRKRLKNIYAQIATDERWPNATDTQDISEWVFTCKVQTPNLGIYSACKFNYMDYAGGRITEEMDFEDPEFDQKLRSADVVLALLDGTKIMSLIREENLGKSWIVKDLSNILSIIQTNDKPVHFLVSKWDIVQKYYNLEQIRDCLLEVEEFKDIVRNRYRKESPVRLIPISSVGSGFAELQPDGSMKKTGVMPKPFQIEVPLACVIPDIIRKLLKELEDKQKEEKDREIKPVNDDLTWWDKLKKYTGGGVKKIASYLKEYVPPKYQFASEILEELIDIVDTELTRPVYQKEEEARKKTEELKQKKAASLEKIDDDTKALSYCVTCFAGIIDKLDRDFPASKLEL
jgi:hypothetical protein